MTLIAHLLAGCADDALPSGKIVGADPERGQRIAERAACGACHDIPGVAWPRGRLGGSLQGFAGQTLIAGRFPNQPDILVRWLRDPPAMSPESGMPPSRLTFAEARDVAAFLYTLE